MPPAAFAVTDRNTTGSMFDVIDQLPNLAERLRDLVDQITSSLLAQNQSDESTRQELHSNRTRPQIHPTTDGARGRVAPRSSDGAVLDPVALTTCRVLKDVTRLPWLRPRSPSECREHGSALFAEAHRLLAVCESSRINGNNESISPAVFELVLLLGVGTFAILRSPMARHLSRAFVERDVLLLVRCARVLEEAIAVLLDESPLVHRQLVGLHMFVVSQFVHLAQPICIRHFLALFLSAPLVPRRPATAPPVFATLLHQLKVLATLAPSVPSTDLALLWQAVYQSLERCTSHFTLAPADLPHLLCMQQCVIVLAMRDTNLTRFPVFLATVVTNLARLLLLPRITLVAQDLVATALSTIHGACFAHCGDPRDWYLVLDRVRAGGKLDWDKVPVLQTLVDAAKRLVVCPLFDQSIP